MEEEGKEVEGLVVEQRECDSVVERDISGLT